MKKGVSLRYAVMGLVLAVFVAGSTAGCMTGTRKTPAAKPSPTRPSPTRTTPMTPTGKRTGTRMLPAPVTSALAKADLQSSCDRIRAAVGKNDFAAASREADKLRTLYNRFKAAQTGKTSPTDMRAFDANYTKLQKDVRMKNAAGSSRSISALKDTISKMKIMRQS